MPASRKTQVPVQSLPTIVDWLLKNSTGEQLAFLNRLANTTDLKLMVGIIRNFKDFNIYEVFSYRMKDEKDLAYFRASKVGEVAAFDALLYAVQGAKIEIERRRKEAKK